MKVNLTYSDMTLIVGIVEKELKELRAGIARMKGELKNIDAAEKAGAQMCEEMEMKMEMKEEELQAAIMTDSKRCTDLSNLLNVLQKKC